MTGYRLTGPAELQIALILAWSAHEYGLQHAANYEALILVAMADVAAEPGRLGTKRVARSHGVRVYDLWHSRNRVPRNQRIRDPGHKIL
jgi:toxin ParE1/3/4